MTKEEIDGVTSDLGLRRNADECRQIASDLADKRAVYFGVASGCTGYGAQSALIAIGPDGQWWFWEGWRDSQFGFELQWGLERAHPHALIAKRFGGDLDNEEIHAAVRAAMTDDCPERVSP